MASSSSTINNSSAVPHRGLKKLTMKLRTKLEQAKGSVHKKKASANTGKAVIEPNLTNEQVQIVIAKSIVKEPKRNANESIATAIKPMAAKEEVLAITADPEPLKEEKAEQRAARKEARKAKWAARRAAFKAKAHKIGEALFIPVAVVCGIVFGPLILAFDVCLCAFKAVVWLVVKIVDCLSAPFVACFYFCR